jgi:peroxiredoxin
MNRTNRLVFVLACLNILLIYSYAVKRSELATISALYHSSRALAVSLPRFVLPDMAGQPSTSDEILGRDSYTLFVFLSPSDCSPCLEEVNLWRRLASGRQGLGVCAIARHTNIRELRQWIKNIDINFPVLYDEGGLVTSEFGIISSPFKVLANRQGRVLLKEGPSYNNTTQRAFIRRLEDVRKYSE